jgi:glycosyltransferase involved in cell wall biosynthesis
VLESLASARFTARTLLREVGPSNTGPARVSRSASHPIRALFILPSLDGGGAERVTLNLLSLLDRDRFQPSLLLLERRGALLEEVPGDLPILSIDHGQGRRSTARLLMSLIAPARAADVIVAGLQCCTTYLAWLAGTIAHRPVIGWVQNAAVPGSPMSRLRHRTLMRVIQPRLAASVFPCARAYEALAQRIPLARTRVELIPNFISYERVRRLATAHSRLTCKRITGEIVLTAVGRLAPQKGFDTLLRAVHHLHAHGYRCRLIILGEGPDRACLMRQIAELSLQGFVEMPGFVANPYPVMRHSDVFVLSSRFEGLPLALMEARALGIPIVATDCVAGPRELLEGGRHGILVPVNDHAAIAAAIVSIIEERRHHAKTENDQFPDEPTDTSERTAVTAWEALLTDLSGREVDRYSAL